MKIELANFHELQAFSQFGSDLDAQTKKTLAHGEALMEVLKQGQYQPMSYIRQVIELFTAKQGYLDSLKVSDIHPFLDQLYTFIDKNHHELIKELEDKKEMSAAFTVNLDKVVKDFVQAYK